MRSDYKICPLCGAVLDIGERCDCKEDSQGDYKIPLEIIAQGQQPAPRSMGTRTIYVQGATRSPKTSPKEEANILLRA